MQVKLEIKGLKALQNALTTTARELERAEVMAINKTATKAKTEMKRAISSEFMLTQREIAPHLRIRKARKGHVVATLDPFDSPSKPGSRSMNLIHFMEKKVTMAQYRKRRKAEGRPQLRFKIKRTGGGLKTIRGAFIGNKGRTVFKRTGKGRLPIKPVQTIGVPGMFNTRRINERVLARIRKELPIEMDRAVAQVIRKRFK